MFGHPVAFLFIQRHAVDDPTRSYYAPGALVGGVYHVCYYDGFEDLPAYGRWYKEFSAFHDICSSAFGGYVVKLPDWETLLGTLSICPAVGA
jgi:hypothetical protein